MERIVGLTPGAIVDIQEIARFISSNVSSASTSRWMARTKSSINRLETEADRFPEAREAAALGINLREMLCGRRPHVYRILFTFDANTVTVYRVRHAAQDELAEGDI